MILMETAICGMPSFSLETFFPAIIEEARLLGRDVTITRKDKRNFGRVESAFLKDNTDVYNITFQMQKQTPGSRIDSLGFYDSGNKTCQSAFVFISFSMSLMKSCTATAPLSPFLRLQTLIVPFSTSFSPTTSAYGNFSMRTSRIL